MKPKPIWARQLFKFSFFLLPISLLLREHWSSKVLILFFVSGLIFAFKTIRHSFFAVYEKSWYKAALLFLLVALLSLIYSSDLEIGFHRLSFPVLMVLFPIFQYSLLKDLKNTQFVSKVFLIFAIAVYGYSLLILIKLFGIYFFGRKELVEVYAQYGYLNFENILGFSQINGMYFSQMLGFAFLILLERLSRIKNLWHIGFFFVGIMSVTLATLLLIDSKIAYVVFSVLLVLFFSTAKIAGSVKWGLIVLFVVAVAYSVILNPPPRVKKFMEIGDNTRLNNYRSSIGVIEKNFFFGVGLGGELNALQNQRQQAEKVDHYIILMEHNAHNQYFETMIATGIIGVVPFVLLIGLSFVRAIRQKSALFFGFLLILTLFFFVESVLVRHYGFIFCAFIWSLFLVSENSQQT